MDNPIRIEFVRVAMRDGVELLAKITRPDVAGRFPGIMEYNPYRRLRKPLPDSRDEYPPVVPYLVERGYAVVQFDVRGTANSGGFSTQIYSPEERQDAFEMVEWIASQPWCCGDVGMIGKSYSAVVQWQVAAQNPPALKAIIVRSANDDVYTEWVYPGGCLRPYMFDTYSPLMNAYNLAPPDPDVVGDEWESLWAEHLEKNGPWGIGYLSNPLQGPYWHDQSLATDYRRVRCAVYVIGGWSDCYATALLRAYAQLDCPKKALVGPWSHYYAEEAHAVPGPRIDTRPLYQRWFDFWLKGIDNGVMDEPPVTLFVRDYQPPAVRMPLTEPGRWRNEHEWPIARTRATEFFPSVDGQLAEQPSPDPGRLSLEHRPGSGLASGIHWGGGILPWGMPVDQRLDDAHSLLFATPPLDRDLEITGDPVAVLFVSSTAEVAYFRVRLIDAAPDGTSKLVRYGGLNATHRDSHSDPQPLVPGTVYEINVPLKTVSYVFPAGHRLLVAISTADFQNAWPTGKLGTHTVHLGGETSSKIILPVVPDPSAPAPAPEFVELPPADPKALMAPPVYEVIEDQAADTASVRLGIDSQDGNDTLSLQSTFTVSNREPADAVLDARAVYTVRRDGLEVVVRADESTTSDSEHFRHEVSVEITRDGKPAWEKNWTVSVPRQWS